MKSSSILFKTSLAVGVASTVLLLVAGGFFIRSEADIIKTLKERNLADSTELLADREKVERDTMESNLRFNGRMLANISAGFIFNFDKEGLEPALTSFMDILGVEAIQVEDNGQNAFAAIWTDDAGKPLFGQEIPEEIEGAGYSTATHDAVYEEEAMGEVTLFYTDRHIKERLQLLHRRMEARQTEFADAIGNKLMTATIQQGIGLAGIIALLLLLITALLNRLVRQPVSALSRSVEKIREDGNLGRRIQRVSQDEVGSAVGSINDLLAQFQRIVRTILL